MKGVGIGWSINWVSGWGIYGTNLTLQLAKRKPYHPLWLMPPTVTLDELNPLHRVFFQPIFQGQQDLLNLLSNPQNKQFSCDFTILYAMGKDFAPSLPHITGKKRIGVVFCEDSRLTPNAIQQANTYDLIIAGCTWNEKIFKNHGLKNVCKVLQGVDPTLFHPAPKSNLFADRFVIFSGGKLEYRKGQDIVVAAFKHFHARHPEALLLIAWHNFWVKSMAGLEQTGHVIGLPKIDSNRRLQIGEWLIENGIPAHAIIDLGIVPNHQIGQILREADVAVFPNRCEGGTNLVAMECLACGIPTVLSVNTGHLDLIDDTHCYPLHHQGKVFPSGFFNSVEDWGESDVEEVVECLEEIYRDRQTAQQRGHRAAQFMQNLTWENQITRLLAVVDDLL